MDDLLLLLDWLLENVPLGDSRDCRWPSHPELNELKFPEIPGLEFISGW